MQTNNNPERQTKALVFTVFVIVIAVIAALLVWYFVGPDIEEVVQQPGIDAEVTLPVDGVGGERAGM